LPARDKPWFKTDGVYRCRRSHGGQCRQEDLPLANYHIPLFIYAPAHINLEFQQADQPDRPGAHAASCSMDYISTSAAMCCARTVGRALLGNYQHLGLFDGS
jgi:hypothetical protein